MIIDELESRVIKDESLPKLIIFETQEDKNSYCDSKRINRMTIETEKEILLTANNLMEKIVGRRFKGIEFYEPKEEETSDSTLVTVNGKNFKCTCGANVFSRVGDTFTCHGCGKEWLGQNS